MCRNFLRCKKLFSHKCFSSSLLNEYSKCALKGRNIFTKSKTLSTKTAMNYITFPNRNLGSMFLDSEYRSASVSADAGQMKCDNSTPVPVNSNQLRQRSIGSYVTMKGYITVQKVSRYALLKDGFGSVQLTIPMHRKDLIQRISKMDKDSFVTVVGTIHARPKNRINEKVENGEIEIDIYRIEDGVSSTKRQYEYSTSTQHVKQFCPNNSRMQVRNYSTETKLTVEELNRCGNESITQEFLQRTYTCGDLKEAPIGTEITLCGWLDNEVRKNRFFTMYDGFGYVQIVIPDEKEKEIASIVETLDAQKSLVKITGVLRSRTHTLAKHVNGTVEILLKELEVLHSNNVAPAGPKKTPNTETQDITENGILQENNSTNLLNSYTTRTHTCGELNPSHINKEVTLCGWLEFSRLNKFLLLRDSYGSTQIIVDEKDAIFIDNLHLETVLRVTGTVQARPPSQVNNKYSTGEIEVIAKSVQILNKSIANLPFLIRDYNKANEQKLNRYRYLALRFPELQKNLRLRSEMIFKMREFLVRKKGFVEVETPTLFRRTPGGAQEFIVPTHIKNKYYCLVQSPQQFKQMLMVGSVDRYFQIARCYRDERTNTEKQPEFTQLDIELSFPTAESIMQLIEEILVASWPSDKNPIATPFCKMTYKEAIEKYGSDKPCLFEKLLIQSMENYIDEQLTNAAYMFVIPNGQVSFSKLKKKIDELNEVGEVKLYAIKIPTIEKLVENLSKILPNFQAEFFRNCVSVNNNDILVLAVGSNKDATLKSLGKCRHETINLSNMINELNEKGIYEFVWVIDFPLLEVNELGQLKSTHHPFTHPHPEDMGMILDEAMNARSLAYDLVLNGSEIGGGSIRIHNSELQKTIFKILGLQEEDFSHLLEALKMGCPPHGGIALGVDRLFAILCDCRTIKDVIAFPKGTFGQDLMTNCPSDISNEDKIRYHIPTHENSDSSPQSSQDEEL